VGWAAPLKAIQGLKGIKRPEARSQNDVAISTLRGTQAGEIDHCLAHAITSLAECLDREISDVCCVMLHRWDVLDQDDSRSEYFSRSGHSGVERVSWVVAPRVVVQVRIALARRAAEQNVDFTYHFADTSL
jgi:hypothetical protein